LVSKSLNSKLIGRFSGLEGPRRLRDTLLKQSIFQGNVDIVDRVAAKAKIEHYESGQILITQGDADSDIIFILVGNVVVSPNQRDDTIRRAGSHVGELSAIDPSVRRSASVRANEQVIVARLREPDFSTIADEFPQLWRYLAQDIAQRLRERVLKVQTRNSKVRLFIGSSSEGLAHAKLLSSEFANDPFEIKLWIDDIFLAGNTNIESLENEVKRSDFAALLLSPDDRLFSRWRISKAPRDNLIFELGLFMGAIGRNRALIISPHGKRLKLPSDLDGMAGIRYSTSDMTSAAGELRKIIKKFGVK
jgi:CRP/FNR family transcriptional regulator, cyclic AMP receptor protein